MKKPTMKLNELRRALVEEMALSRRTGHAVTPANMISALRQRGHLCEVENVETPVDQEELGDSVDSQVDRYLADYERNAGTNSEPAEQMEWRSLVRGMVLAEALEEEEPPAVPPAEGDDDPGAGEMEDPSAAVEPPPKLGLEDIDVERFGNDVARLIQNYDNLLEIRRTLIRRSVNFIAKNYDERVVKELKASLRDNHGLMPDQTQLDHEEEDFPAPRAGEAGPGGGGV